MRNGGKIYGLIGRALGHSWSRPIHYALGCPDYRLIELEPNALPAFLARDDIGGLNVAMPYKKAVLPYCDWVDEYAAAIGSVNTLTRGPDGKLRAWNTDALGFRAMARLAGISFRGRKALILGSGGAALSVQAEVRRRNPRDVVLISRTGENRYDNLTRHADAEILINATPVGMYPENGNAPLDLTAFPSLCGVLDLIYNPRRTALLLQAESLGVACSDGLPMLVAQAAVAEGLFFGAEISEALQFHVLSCLRQDRTNLVLIGMPGCGKSTIGRALSLLTGREAVDIDARIARRAGKTVPEIFATDGEAAFRDMERRETANAGKETGKILITGGGVVKDERNYAALKQNGRIYHLLRDLSLLPTAGRPLSPRTGPERLWKEREVLYRRFRDCAVDNNGSVQDTAQAVWEEFCAHSGD